MTDKQEPIYKELFERWRDGDKTAYNAIIEQQYHQLTQIAHRRLRGERPGHTLETNGLVNEVYKRLAQTDNVPWESAAGFLSTAGWIMRKMLIDHARKHGRRPQGAVADLPVKELMGGDFYSHEVYMDIQQFLSSLAANDTRAYQLAELRLWGYTFEEISQITEIEISKVKREWNKIKKNLSAYLNRKAAPSTAGP